MDKIMEVKQALAIYANENDIPAPAVNLMEKLIENNVSYADADKFCEEHFINKAIADIYKEFYNYLANTKAPEPQVRELHDAEIIDKIREYLNLLESRLKRN